MLITDLISITELSRLTKKSRPTIYKYCDDFQKSNYDNIPYSFLILFEKACTGEFSKENIVEYCNKTFFSSCQSEELNEIVKLITENINKINIKNLKNYILEEIENDKRDWNCVTAQNSILEIK